jgi:hypothetical protein
MGFGSKNREPALFRFESGRDRRRFAIDPFERAADSAADR